MPAAEDVDLDLARYIALRRGAAQQRVRDGSAYAYSGERRIARAALSVRPVTLALEATVRLWKSVKQADLLGSAVKVTDQQFPRLYQIAERCAATLQIAVPTLYVAPELSRLNAQTLGTDEDAFIVLNAALVDHLSDSELAFVIGHECGHIQNNHVVFTTTLYYLNVAAAFYVRWIVQPAVIALNAWSRRAEITGDRAGLLCVKDPRVAEAALVKLALGSQKLYAELDIEAYLAQLAEGRRNLARLGEAFRDHPYLPKRIEALRHFARSAYFLRHTGAGDGGLTAAECDAEVARLVSVL